MKMKLTEFKIEEPEIITGDRIMFHCFVNSVRYQKVDFLFQNGFWRNHYQTTVYPPNMSIIVSGHGDFPIVDSIIQVYKQKFPLKKWFGTNMDASNEIAQGIPIGVTNYCDDSPIHKILGDNSMIMNCLKEKKQVKHLCYLNLGDTFPERKLVQEKFQTESWCFNPGKRERQDFLFDVYDSKFVLCPRGNGIDTHRLWESLYLQSIPIVKRCQAMSYFEDLPILWIDDWNEITKEFLEQKYEEIINKDWPLYKLQVSYWNKLIKN